MEVSESFIKLVIIYMTMPRNGHGRCAGCGSLLEESESFIKHGKLDIIYMTMPRNGHCRCAGCVGCETESFVKHGKLEIIYMMR